MPDKIFIGKVFEKTFSNGGSVIKLTLEDAEIEKLTNYEPPVTIEIKKSKAGKWYAEISQFKPSPRQQEHNPDDLPF